NLRRLAYPSTGEIDDAVCVLVGSFGAPTHRERAAAWARQPVLHRFDFGARHSRALLGGRARARRLHADCDADDGADRHLRQQPAKSGTTAIVSQPGSTNVTINMLSGAQLNVNSDAVVLNAGGQVNNASGAIIQGVRGINVTGPAGIANDGQISGNGGPGVVLNGPGHSILTNTGPNNGSGGTAFQFNTVALSSQTLNNTGNGSINGNVVGSGDGGISIVNAGNFNGGITISGNGVNSITTQSGHNINGQVSITGNAQTTILNGGAFNNGLVISGAGVNSITNQAGAFINQVFSVTGSQNTINTPARSTTGSRLRGVASIRSRTGPERSSTRPSASPAARTRSPMPARSTTGSPWATASTPSRIKAAPPSTRRSASPPARTRSPTPARSTTESQSPETASI